VKGTTVQEAFRLFVRDSIEAAVATAAALILTLPTSIDDAKRVAVIVGTAIFVAVVAVGRRVLLPAILQWVYPKP
jgi:hypothetical protein